MSAMRAATAESELGSEFLLWAVCGIMRFQTDWRLRPLCGPWYDRYPMTAKRTELPFGVGDLMSAFAVSQVTLILRGCQI